MIDVYREFFFKALDTRPFEIGAFDHEDGVVLSVDPFDVADVISPRETPISRGHLAANDHIGGLTKAAKQPIKTKGRSDTVTIRLDVRRDPKILLIFN